MALELHDQPGDQENHPMTDLGWWAISGAALMDALKRANDGEDADLIYLELYANTETKDA